MKPSALEHPLSLAVLALALPALLTRSTSAAQEAADAGAPARREKVLHLPMRSSGPGSLDPVLGSTVYDNRACSNVYETLLQYKYLKRPFELEPLLLEEMPTTEDGLTWHFKLKQGVRFHNDRCFEGGRGRELVTDDVFYSFKRLADLKYELKSWWLLKDTILGLDELKVEQTALNPAGRPIESRGRADQIAHVRDLFSPRQ